MAVPSERCYECGCTARQDASKPYCTDCGHRRDAHALVCGHCKELLGDSTAFCEHCGTRIERVPAGTGGPAGAPAAPTAAAQAAPPPPSAAPSRSSSSACTLCDCVTYRFVLAEGACGTCGHEAAAHNLSAADVAALGRGEPIAQTTSRGAGTIPPPASGRSAPTPLPRELPVSARPLAVAPKGLIAAAWVAGIFAALSIVVGIAAYSDSSNQTTTFGGQVQDAANTAALIGGIGIGAFWLMVCCFCAGLHGHLDRIARATIERGS